MKKILISFAALAVSAAAIIAVNANNRMDEQFEANVEALAEGEGGGVNCPGMCSAWGIWGGGGIDCLCNYYSGNCKSFC